MSGTIVPEFHVKEELIYELKTRGISPIESIIADLHKLLRTALQTNTLPDSEKLEGINVDLEHKCCVSKLSSLVEMVENVEDEQSGLSITREEHGLANLGRRPSDLLIIAKHRT
ncbi:hypothetical protein PR048_016571 [Dryococelus australis]|uniref:Uncharacterized protein n=1 Tax=Dryococelus australis TaxID=614101 RepID=A0ABQ9HK36_9NEOP|nr:hypothetical protein PR048_016571 [Dryococelus australis]